MPRVVDAAPLAQPPAPVSSVYPMWIDAPGATETCRECANRTTQRPGPGGILFTEKLGPDPKCPFCNGTGQKQRKMLVRDHRHHSAIVGYEVGEDGNRVRPLPPTLDEVVAAGYSEEAAKAIVAREADHAAKGYPPYGDNPMPKPESVAPVPPQPVAPVPVAVDPAPTPEPLSSLDKPAADPLAEF